MLYHQKQPQTLMLVLSMATLTTHLRCPAAADVVSAYHLI